MPTSQLVQFDGQFIDGLDFCKKVYALFESIRSSEEGVSRLRMRKSRTEKKLIEELLPICKYVQANYRLGRYVTVCWVDGNQNYDAEIRQSGEYISQGYYQESGYLEVTCVMHPNEYLRRELLETKGGAFGLEGIRRLKSREIESVPVSYSGNEFVQSYSKLVLKQIAKKIKIQYPENTTLIVECNLNYLYMPNEWEELITCVVEAMPKSSFREVYLYDSVRQYSYSLYEKNDT